jgi:predicted nuclease of predicted toxin-antitoxin system
MERATNGEFFIRLYVDADITPKLARTLRARGYDAISAHEVGLAEVSDAEHMAFAVSQGRTLLTCNARDFTPIFEDLWFAGKEHSGVIVSEQLEPGEMLRRVLRFLDVVSADEMRNNWKNLAEFAVRLER